MMHEARGAGLRGKRGMQVKNGFIIRPFLDITRHEIEIYIIENALPYVTDDSNYDLNLNRNYLRHSTIPALERKNPNCSKKVYQESLRASKKLDALSKKASLFLKKHAQGKAFDRKAFNRLNEEVKSEIIIQLLGANDLYKRSIERLMSFVKNGASGKKLTVKGKTFVIEYDKIIFYSKTKETALPKKPIRPNGIKWGEWKIESKSSKPLFVRSWKAGDRFQPSGMKGHKKLQDFFVDQKIPKRRRHQIPIIVDENDDIICVGTLRYSNQAKYLDVRISNSD